jgi:hypothetical protein
MGFARDYYHWCFLIQPAPLPERLIGADPRFYLRTKIGGWGALDSEFFDVRAVAEYERSVTESTKPITIRPARRNARRPGEEGAAMSQLGRLRWGWILVGGVVAELALMLFVPIQFLPGGERALFYLVVPLCVIVTGLAGYWVARQTDDLRVLHGGFVGAVALLIYAALTWTVDLPAIYWVANYLKVAGGLMGGWVADRRIRAQGSDSAAWLRKT